MTFSHIGSVEAATEALASQGYLADRPLALAVQLAVVLEQPLLLEGEAGVGKTEVARALAAATGARLIRLQCHEGIDVHHAVYDWDYPRQLLALRAAEGGVDEGELFSRRFLLRRPLLDALEAGADDAGGAADRRDRPGRRRVRGVPARVPGGFRRDDPGARDDRRGAAADGVPDLEPHPRAARRAQAALPVPLDRLPERRARAADRARPHPGRSGVDREPRGHRRGAAPRTGGPVQAARRGRDARVGARAAGARRDAELDETLGVALKVHEDVLRVCISRSVLDGV